MTTHTGRAFNEWLRTQLKAKKMSQRQLAQQSGVDHSTISRLIRGDRMPSLGTATALARGLREIREDADTTQYLGVVANGSASPTARVEYALRADDSLGEAQVRQIMEYYLAVRLRRFGRVFSAPELSPNAASTKGSDADVDLGQHASPGSSNGPTGRGAEDGSAGPRRGEPLPAGSRPLGFAHLPPRPQGLASAGFSVRRDPAPSRGTTTPTITRQSGRGSDRY
ncbi:MAG: helix-turn-helix transcriptional regulator [Candidatus Limnocylindrales bacterium]